MHYHFTSRKVPHFFVFGDHHVTLGQYVAGLMNHLRGWPKSEPEAIGDVSSTNDRRHCTHVHVFGIVRETTRDVSPIFGVHRIPVRFRNRLIGLFLCPHDDPHRSSILVSDIHTEYEYRE